MGRTVGRGLAPSKRAPSPVKLPAPCPPEAGTVFSLGSALFDWPLALGYHASSDAVPSAWSESFIDCADGDTYWGLFTACGPGRVWVLRTAKRARLTLHIEVGACDAAWLRQLAAIRDALAIRGARRTELTIVFHTGDHGGLIAKLGQVAEALAGVSQGITALHLETYTSNEGAVVTACPNLTTLHLSRLPAALPPPSSLPHLTHLSLGSAGGAQDAEVFRIVAPFVTQLQSLKLPSSYRDTMPWPCLFPKGTSATHLTTLSTDSLLDSELCGLLLDRAPALTHLSVRRVELSESLRDRSWALRELSVTPPSQRHEPLAELAMLPTSTSQRFVYKSRYGDYQSVVRCRIASPEGLDAAIAERLCEWRIEFKDIRVCPADDALLAADQAVALRNTLRQFGDLQTSDGAVVTLSRWQWTADTVQVAAEALPALPHLTFGLYTPQPLTDELLRHVVSMGPRMRYLTVDSLSLQSSHHRIKWPWDQLSIQTVDVIQLTKLPNPRGSKWTRHIDAHNISLRKAAKLGPAPLKRLTEWLWFALWNGRAEDVEQVYSDVDFHVSVEGSQAFAQLQAQMALLKAFRVTKWVLQYGNVNVSECKMDAASMDLLQGLPAWGEKLTFNACEWPEVSLVPYKKLGRSIPPSFQQWWLRSGPGVEAVRALCQGADRRRFGLGLEKLQVYLQGYEGEDGEEIGAHVRLYTFDESEEEGEEE